MPRARFDESLFKRDRLGRFAKSAGGGKPRPKKLRPGVTNAQRRELGSKKLKAANTLRGHEDYAEKNAERVAAGKSELAGIGNTRKQLPRAQERLAAASRALDGLYLPTEEHTIAKEEIAKRIADRWKPGAKSRPNKAEMAEVRPGDVIQFGNGSQRWTVVSDEGDHYKVTGDLEYRSGSSQTRKIPKNRVGKHLSYGDRDRERERYRQRGKWTDSQIERFLNKQFGRETKPTGKITGKAGSSRKATGLTKERRDRIQLNARAKKVARERAKEDARPSSLRRQLIAATKKVGDLFNSMDFDEFKSWSEEEKQNFRETKLKVVDEMSDLEEKLKNAKPDRSRKLSSATSRGELVDIMADRYPGLKMEGWDEPDGALAQELRQFDGRLDNATVTKKCIQAFQSMDQQMQKYPEVKLDLGFNAWSPTGFSNPNAIAHCRRGPFLAIDFNVRFLSIKSPADGSPKKEGELGFHPPNFFQRPWGNTVVHEFGHAVDWYANGFMDVYERSEDRFRKEEEAEKKGGRKARSRAEIQEETQQALAMDRGSRMKKLIAGLYVDAGEPDHRVMDSWERKVDESLTPEGRTKHKLKAWMATQMSGYSFHQDNGRKGQSIMFDDEALAEAWMDVEHNGDGASDTSKALHGMMLEGLEGGKEGRAQRNRQRLIDTFMKLGLSRKEAEEEADK